DLSGPALRRLDAETSRVGNHALEGPLGTAFGLVPRFVVLAPDDQDARWRTGLGVRRASASHVMIRIRRVPKQCIERLAQRRCYDVGTILRNLRLEGGLGERRVRCEDHVRSRDARSMLEFEAHPIAAR